MKNPALPYLAAVFANAAPVAPPADPTIVISAPTEGQHFSVGALSVTLTVEHTGWLPTELEVVISLDGFVTSSTATYGAGDTWSGTLTTSTEAVHTVSARVRAGSGSWRVATPVHVSTAPTYVAMTVTGSTFAPVITRRAGSSATARWVCTETAQELTGDAPTFTFGSQATRHIRLYVEAAAVDTREDVRTLNLGFNNGDDQGRYSIGAASNRGAQPVTQISNLNSLTGLVQFMAASTPLTSVLDFTGCSSLQFIECYMSQVSGVVLTGCTSLIRLCLEGCRVSTLDLNPVAGNLYDLRAAIQQAGIAFATVNANLIHLYHYCVRDQLVTNMVPCSRMPALEELWVWNTQQTGPLAPSATVTSLMAYNNHWASYDLSACQGATQTVLTTCSMTTAEVDAVLAQVNAWGTSNRNLDLRGNAGPSSAGTATAGLMAARGWNVQLEAQVGGLAVSQVASSVTQTTATISWTTNEPATSTVEYGATSSYGSTVTSPDLVTAHAVVLTGLTAAQLRHYRVSSTSNVTVSSADATFTTASVPVSTSLNATTVEVIGTNQIRATYTWASSAELADWTPTAGTTLGVSSNIASVTGGTNVVHGMRWNQPIAASRVRVSNIIAVSGSSIRIYTNMTASYNEGTEWNPLLGHVWNTAAPFFKLWPTPGSNQNTSFPNLVNGTSYTFQLITTPTSIEAWSALNNQTQTYANTNAPVTTGRLVIGGAGNLTMGTVVIEGEVAPGTSGDAVTPVMTLLAAAPGSTTATITFTTSESATSTCEFGTTSTYGQAVSGTAATSHTLSLTGLTPDTLYHYRVTVADAAGNAATASDYTFRTVRASAYPAVSVVVLGASTAQGLGASDLAHSWVSLFRGYLTGLNAGSTVTNLAVGGQTSYHLMPTGYVPPGGRPTVNQSGNITAAIALNPDLIIVALGSNDVVDAYATSETHDNYAAIMAAADAAGIATWVTSITPRNLDANGRAALAVLRDWQLTTYAARSVDVWTTMANLDGTIATLYNADDTHPNNAGHRLIYSRVQSSGMLNAALL